MFGIGLAAIPAAAVLWLAYRAMQGSFLMPGFCVFSAVFGMYCPGCGGTRALEALFCGRLFLATWYHPLVPYTAAVYSGFMLSWGLHRLGVKRIRGWRFHNWYLYAGAGIVVFNFILKNILRFCFGILL